MAPVALYPDELLGQILAATTYPLEIIEAALWLQLNGNLQGQALIDAARQQDWDPSIQLLVGFPDVITLLNRDIRWTTDLGNAFLAQQADVMNAVQVMRLRAKNNGRLTTTPQQVVSSEAQDGQYAVRIEPANPQVIYPPVYNPAYVWGPPPVGAYPPVSYYGASDPYGYGGYSSGGYGFGQGVNIGSLFSGLVSWNGWGWVLGWFTHSLSLASLFFNVLGFHGSGGGGYGGSGFRPGVGAGTLALWSHNPAHRLGVAYPRGFSIPRSAVMVAGARSSSSRDSRLVASSSPASASRVLSSGLSSSEGRSNPAAYNRAGSEAQRYGGPSAPSYRPDMARSDMTRSGMAPNSFASPARTAPGYEPNAYQNAPHAAPPQASSQRYFAPSQQQHYSEQRMASSRYSEPKMSTQHYSAPKYSAPKFSAPKFSAPKHPGGGGHSGKSSRKH